MLLYSAVNITLAVMLFCYRREACDNKNFPPLFGLRVYLAGYISLYETVRNIKILLWVNSRKMVEVENGSSTRIGSAASLLIKGGTLSDKPCPKCQGVLVLFNDKSVCVNCGSEETMANVQHKIQNASEESKEPIRQASSNLAIAAMNIEEKIAIIAQDLRNEADFLIQKQKAELLERYLSILQNMKNLNATS